MLCLKGRQVRLCIIYHGTNKDQLLHRIQSIRTFTNLQYLYNFSTCPFCTTLFYFWSNTIQALNLKRFFPTNKNMFEKV